MLSMSAFMKRRERALPYLLAAPTVARTRAASGQGENAPDRRRAGAGTAGPGAAQREDVVVARDDAAASVEPPGITTPAIVNP